MTPKPLTKLLPAKMNLNQATGLNNIPPEALKEGEKVMVEILYTFLNKIWREEEIPNDWKIGLLIKLAR